MWDLGAGLDGRGVIVTGAAGGIGAATVEALAAAGARVAAVDRDADGVVAAIAGLDEPSRHRAIAFDLADVAAIPTLVASVSEEFGDLWALVHVAAVLRRQHVDDVTEDDWDLHASINLKASFFLNRAAGQALIAAKGGGRIINFASSAWQLGALSGSDAYVATKGGIVTMARSFARQYGPHGILVNVVAPGQVDTPMQHVDNPPAIVRAAIEACPLRRMGRPEELASVVVFLASVHASFVHGAVINVSGGSLLY